jgi:small glutamine-rich tetratricopeptide repeat-containing protein alpha
MSQQHLAFAVARWLRDSGKDAAAAAVEQAFSVRTADAAQAAQFGAGPGLQQIFDIFLKTQSKMGTGAASSGSASAAPAAAPAPAAAAAPSSDDLAKAEALKADGNKAMSAKDYSAAIAAYSKAIELNGASAVYFSNRSAAYAQLGQHDAAVADAHAALGVDATFSKAYSRLGHALFSSGRFQEAADAYAKGLELDPASPLMKSGLETAKKHAADAKPAPAPADEVQSARGAPAQGGGMPDLSALAGMMGGMGGGGGMPDLAR